MPEICAFDKAGLQSKEARELRTGILGEDVKLIRRNQVLEEKQSKSSPENVVRMLKIKIDVFK